VDQSSSRSLTRPAPPSRADLGEQQLGAGEGVGARRVALVLGQPATHAAGVKGKGTGVLVGPDALGVEQPALDAHSVDEGVGQRHPAEAAQGGGEEAALDGGGMGDDGPTAEVGQQVAAGAEAPRSTARRMTPGSLVAETARTGRPAAPFRRERWGRPSPDPVVGPGRWRRAHPATPCR
jgi:hypothetical protein